MSLRSRQSPAEGDLLFEIDPEPIAERLTAWGGLPLLVRTLRSLDVGGSVKRHLRVKQRRRGLDEASYVESFVVLNALGGDCLDDFARLQEDPGVVEMLGHGLPSPEAARKFLYQFHDEDQISAAQQELGLGQVSYIPDESAALRGLAQVNQDCVREVGRRCREQKIATIDLDATVIESWKREAQPTYQGSTGYQPLLALWAETDLAVADEFRDGNVPAQQEPLRVAQRALPALPDTVEEYYFRGDSACWEKNLVEWLRDEHREGGPEGPIGFAISMRMNPTLKSKIERLAEEAWKPYQQDATAVKECAEVSNYWPEWKKQKEDGPLRYVAIRVRKRQGELFRDGESVKHYAVATNVWEWSPKQLLEWHREKAGSIEALHDVLKNELAAGVLPCGRFGANAAWLRLAVLTHNVLTTLKRLALPAELIRARPKRLRFLIFQTPGKLVHHARQVRLRLQRAREQIAAWVQALALLPVPG